MNSIKFGQREFEILASATENDLSWEWHDAMLLKDPEGNLFYLSGAGCSCDSIYDMTEDELVPVSSAAEAVELVKLESFSSEDIFDFAVQATRV